MKRKKMMTEGMILLAAFILWTVLIRTVDVRAIGPEETQVGFAALNGWFHQTTGVHWTIYIIRPWLPAVDDREPLGRSRVGYPLVLPGFPFCIQGYRGHGQ